MDRLSLRWPIAGLVWAWACCVSLSIVRYIVQSYGDGQAAHSGSSMVYCGVTSTQEEPREAQLPPQERVQAVRPFWETLTQEQRVELLSLSIDELRAKAADVTARLKRQSGT